MLRFEKHATALWINSSILALLLFFPLTLSATSPAITGLSPTSGGVGTLETITGASFGAAQGASAVTFNGVTANSIVSWSDTSVAVLVPLGTTTGGVVVTVGGVSSNGATFTVGTANFTLTGSLATARNFQSATELNSGMVLIAGGTDGFAWDALNSAELYSLQTGAFTTTGNLNKGRFFHTATLLTSGQVLFVGGVDGNFNDIGGADLYNPLSGTFTLTGSLIDSRSSHTATLLNNGKVLIAGGVDSNGNQITSLAAGGELYDPATGMFSSTGSLNAVRYSHTATLLSNGKVLIGGGTDINGNALSSAELYDPVAGTFALTGSLNIGRSNHTATLLNNGSVLIAGGLDINGNNVASGELYNPATGAFTVTGSMNTPRYDGAQGTLLNNGMVLLAGGQDNNGYTLASAELYDPVAGTFTVTGSMNSVRQSLTTTLLSNGQVLIAGGMDVYTNVLNCAELYQPTTLAPAGLVSIAVNPGNPSVAVSTTQSFTAVGTFSDNSTQNLASVTWNSSDSTIATITNDATNQGNAGAVAAGVATVAACAGSVCGSATLTAIPNIISVSPNPALAGQWITIVGVGFGAIQGSSSVTVNGIGMSPSSWSDSSITFTLPSNATSGPLAVNVSGTSSLPISFGNAGTSGAGGLVGTYCPALPANEYVAWATPTSVSTVPANNGTVTATLSSASINMTASCPLCDWWLGAEWSGFQVPSIPPGAVVQGIYAAENFSSSGTEAFVSVSLNTPINGEFYQGQDNSVTGACSPNLYPGTTVASIPSMNIGSYLFSSVSYPQMNVTSNPSNTGVAVYYTLPNTPSPSASLFLVDPYNVPSTGGTLSNSVISNLNLLTPPGGIIADGVSTAIAVFQTSVQQDVTFTVTGGSGATLDKWDESFLQDTPTCNRDTVNQYNSFLSCGNPAQPTLLVPAAQLIASQSGGTYYAFALVQAPLVMNSNTIQSQIVVLANQSVGTSGRGTLALHYKPIIFVPGLWGNLGVFSNVLSSLTSTFTDVFALNPICYSEYIPWDAPNDPVSNPLDPCEQTGSDQLKSKIDYVRKMLDLGTFPANGNGQLQPVIAGRFDIVAHSMGGLLSRHYATLPQYFSNRNRRQGDFSEVITIDTPEIGTAVANTFVTLADSQPVAPTALWNYYCQPSDTLRNCFASQGLPMAYQSDNGDCGVIASLQTGYSGISDPSCDFVPAQMGFQNAPSALPNADTFHVAAYFDDQTAPLHSLLRFALNQYVQSVAPGNSLDQILGNDPDGAEPNDVLVTVPSQINNIVLPSGVAATPNLEHTAALPSTYLAEAQLLAGIGFSDENVMNSSLVNAAILCVLVSSGSDTSCVSSPVPSVELGQESLRAEIPQAGNSAPVHQFLAEGRVDVLAPTQPLRLADENEISLRIHAPGLNKLESEQLVYPGIDDSLTPQPLNEAYAQLPILHHPDGSAYIKVTPIRLGHLRLRFWTHFPDGGYTKTEIEVTVEPPERAPTKLIVAQLGMPSQTHMIEMNVYMKPVTNRSAITVSAFYEGVKQLIPIYASYASFEIRTANDASIIDLDRTTGYIKPLQVGEALVKTSFAGWTNLTCVLVESERNPDEGPTPTCESLLLPGEKLATPTQQ